MIDPGNSDALSGDSPMLLPPRCYRCFRPRRHCLCAFVKPFDPGIKLVFLLHPQEAWQQRTGTGRLAHLSLEHSELLVGEGFENHPRVRMLLDDGAFAPFLLFPRANALAPAGAVAQASSAGKRLLVFVLDAKWGQTARMLRESPSIATLPAVSFSQLRLSGFAFKRQPRAGCLSTLESVYWLLRDIENPGLPNDAVAMAEPGVQASGGAENLLGVFHELVQFQLESARVGNVRHRTHAAKG